MSLTTLKFFAFTGIKYLYLGIIVKANIANYVSIILMTLVAAFPMRGIPVLIGDFLLTDNQINKKHNYISTKPGLQNIKPNAKGRRVAGLSKKIYKIGERLIVGFTGDLIPGEKLMKALVKQFSDKSPTKTELESFLSEIDIPNKQNTKLVGWIWVKRPVCFEWKGSAPNNIEIVTSTYSGSGGKHFHDEIMRSDASGISENIKTELEKVIYISVAQAGKILLSELMAAGNLDNAYGFGAEILLWDGSKFFYVEKLAYAFWNIVVNEDDSLTVNLGNILAVYQNFDTFSVMQVSQLDAKHTDFNIITPIYDSMPNFDIRGLKRLSYDAPLWFTGIAIKNKKSLKNITTSIVSDGTKENNSVTTYKDGMIYLNIGQLKATLPQDIFN
jgi:hypothetical protein